MEIFPDTEPSWIKRYGRVALTGESVEFNDYAISLNKYFEISAYQPAPNQFACTFSDITKRVKAEAELKESEVKYSSYIENAPTGIFVVNNNGKYVDVNNAAIILTGYSREELLKMNIGDITAGDSINKVGKNFMQLKENGSMNEVMQYKQKNGSNRWWVINAVKLPDNRFLSFANDITERKKAEDDLVYLIYHDYLTGLHNRKYFEEAKTRLDKAEYLPVSVLIADINGVRFINDSFGYAEGDKLIKETSDILKSCCRPDDVLARIGGDEFAMLLPNTDSGTAYEILKNINNTCEIFNENNKTKLYEINMSIGFNTKENSNEDIGDITKTADVSLRNKKLLNSKSFRSDLISSMMTTVYEKSQETEEHAKRMADLCKRIGEKLNLSQKSLGELELLTMLHDIGKIAIDDSILKKPGKLTDDEWIIMKTHSEVGYRIAKSTSELESIADYILAHHERWDGKGYPSGLTGDFIPLLSRIVAVADAYDAMTNDRVYRKAMTSKEAAAQIKLNSGTQFDPQITCVFETIINDPEYN